MRDKLWIASLLALVLSALGALGSIRLEAQEAIGSDREEYFDMLALSGQLERPTLTYSSLSDNEWGAIEGSHPWEDYVRTDSSRGFGPFKLKLYGPELFASYNTAYPHGTERRLPLPGRRIEYELNPPASAPKPTASSSP